MKYRIGYIDESVRQVQRYERLLRPYFDVVSYEITKGMSLKRLLKLVYESDVDLLMVDYLMVESGMLTFNGDKVAREYEKIKPRFPTLIFTNRHVDAFDSVDNPNIIYEKGDVRNNRPHFVEVLTKNIELYKSYIHERREVIRKLTDKSAKGKLSSLEKHQLLEAQQELNSLDKWNVQIPLQLLDENKIEDLEKTAKDAKAFLSSLIKKGKK
jgi:hypothetical protein